MPTCDDLEGVMQWCVLLKYGELALKGRNRWRFEETLLRNLTNTLADLDGVRIRRRHGVLLVQGAPLPTLLERAQLVLGVALVNPAVLVKPDMAAIEKTAVELLRDKRDVTFAVRPRRRWKGFEARSQEIAIRVGDRIRTELGLKVDLTHPDVELGIEVDRYEALLYTEKLPGQGGLPVGVNGRAITLLSGGFDSPVAAYRAMRRGLSTDFIHFSGMPFTGPQSVYKAYALASQLDRFRGGGSRLWVISFGNAQRSLATAGAGKLQVLAQRRLMVRVASRLGARIGAQAVVTGDSLGQVSSQTLPNLVAVEAAAELPVLRPLLGWDKTEIVAEAERIGTAEISKLPDEDCCTLFASPLAETRADVAELEKIESRLELDPLIDDLIAAAKLHELGTQRDRTVSGATSGAASDTASGAA
ncbi:tRNA uracil 4-sulfurtransferase ThiI [Thermasporomyces composti]|nr:tRNA uracil 4-sulfurtransferase ThiI [Thermasporomyces composti]